MKFDKELHDLFLIQQVYGTLFSLINKLQISGDQYLDGLTSRQFMTIAALLHLPEDEATINQIARKLGTSKQNANRMIGGLEKSGYLTVTPSAKDKRAANVCLTPAGRERVIGCSGQMILFMADAFRNLDTSDLEILWSILKKLYAFDGNEQDGFEEISTAVTADKKTEAALLKTFSDRRNRD